jgi:hypothetical protein
MTALSGPGVAPQDNLEMRCFPGRVTQGRRIDKDIEKVPTI